MVVVSYSGKEINAKLVYYGPGLSGKTTNLEYIYQSVPTGNRGKMVSMKTRTERTLFFDFLPIDLGDIGGFKTRFLLYTVPGQVYYNATRKLVLRGVDAVIFVADSGRGKMEENIESLQNLRENLREYGLSLEEIPWVLQYNKRDLPDAYTLEELEEALNPGGIPYYEAVATTGQGVFECFRGIARLLLQKLSKEIKLGPGASKGAGGSPARPSGVLADNAPRPAAAPPQPASPPQAGAAPPSPSAPSTPRTPTAAANRPYRPTPPAGDRGKTAGRPTFPFPGQASQGTPGGAPRPLARGAARAEIGGGSGETGISSDPFAPGDAPPSPRMPAAPPTAPKQPPAFLAPRATPQKPPTAFEPETEAEEGETAFEFETSAHGPGSASEPETAALPAGLAPSADDERLRRAAELAERLREAEAREAERESRKEGGLLGRLFRRRSRDREEGVEETLSTVEPQEEPDLETVPADPPEAFPPFERPAAEMDGDPFGGDEPTAEEDLEDEPAMAAPPAFKAPAVPLPPVTVERRVRVPVTLSAADIRRGVKLQFILDLDLQEEDEDDGESRESRVA